jgi:hypothetical protein
MKKLWIALSLAMTLILAGCSIEDTLETISDLYDMPVMAQMQQVELTLPEEAAVASMENPEAGKIYLCDGYTLTVQTMESGDLERTLRELTGFEKSQLTLMQTKREAADCFECVWTGAGEGGDQINRTMVLDDGYYHYAVTVMAPADDAGKFAQTWQTIFNSVKLSSTD